MNKSNSRNNTKSYHKSNNGQMSADERIVSSSKARKEKNYRKKLIIRAVLGTVVFIAAMILVVFMFFNINSITVSGDKVYSDSDVIDTSGVKTGDNLIFVSSKKINNALTEKLPYIGSVKIKRHLPATLEIIITKTTAEYAVMNGGSYVIIDSNGKVLEKELSFVGDGVIVADLGAVTSAELGKTIVLQNEHIFNKLLSLDKALKDCGMTGITSVNITNIYDIRLVYQGRITLILGETDNSNLTRKLDLGKEAIKTQDTENDNFCGTINLTVNGKAYLAEETESTTQEDISEESDLDNSEKNSDENDEDKASEAA